MKTLITPVALLLSAMPFAFFKMDKDPWWQGYYFDLDNKTGSACGTYKIKKGHNPGVSTINYFFLYNKDTGYAIACADIDSYFLNKKLDEYTDFFRCPRKSFSYEQNSLSFIFIEEARNLQEEWQIVHLESIRDEIRENNVNEETNNSSGVRSLNGSLLFAANSHLNKSIERRTYHKSFVLELNEDFINERIKKLSKEFRSDSGVFISNKENEITISKDGYAPRDFQKALGHYFETHNRDIAFATAIAKGEGISARLVNNIQFAPFNKELELLNSSNILAIYGVFKGKSGNESIIWGLAEDKDSKKRFHWITDLEADISVLTQ